MNLVQLAVVVTGILVLPFAAVVVWSVINITFLYHNASSRRHRLIQKVFSFLDTHATETTIITYPTINLRQKEHKKL